MPDREDREGEELFGDWKRQDQEDQLDGEAIVDRLLGAGDVLPPDPGRTNLGPVMPAPTLPCNAATHECFRGPCEHFWALCVRGDFQGERVFTTGVQQCNNFLGEATPLSGTNVFRCNVWWPTQLSWVPRAARPLLRLSLRHAWEWWLKRQGYDFSWRTWPESRHFEDTTQAKNGTNGAKEFRHGR